MQLNEMKTLLIDVDHRTKGIDIRVTSIDERVTAIDECVTAIGERVTVVEERVTVIEERVTNIDARTLRIEQILPTLATKDDVERVGREARVLNEAVRSDISLLAEHLSRVLDRDDRTR